MDTPLLKADFDLTFAEERSWVIYEELKQKRVTSITGLIKSAHKPPQN